MEALVVQLADGLDAVHEARELLELRPLVVGLPHGDGDLDRLLHLGHGDLRGAPSAGVAARRKGRAARIQRRVQRVVRERRRSKAVPASTRNAIPTTKTDAHPLTDADDGPDAACSADSAAATANRKNTVIHRIKGTAPAPGRGTAAWMPARDRPAP